MSKIPPKGTVPAAPGHTELSPSNSERWMNCPGSVALCRTVPKPPPSEYAKEGTAAHKLLEMCLKTSLINPYDMVGDEILGVTVNEEMADAVSYAVEEIRTELQKGGVLLSETKVDIFPGIGGTLDAAIYRELDNLVVFDFKYGKGIAVSAADNSQLLLYTIGLMRSLDVASVRLVILQPRTENKISIWDVPKGFLETFEAEIKRKIELTKEPGAFFSSGDWCKFCQAKPVCPCLRGEMCKALDVVDKKELVFPAVGALSEEQIAKLLDYKDRIEDFLAAIASHAQGILEAGGVVPGYELAPKRANRKWKDEVAALKAFADLGEKAFKVAILTPAQMEKLAGKDRVEKECFVPDTGYTIKKTGAKR